MLIFFYRSVKSYMQNIKIEPTIGIVTYISFNSDNSRNVTVECPDIKVAVQFVATNINTQDWVRVCGISRIGDKEKLKPYYHPPYNGTDKEGWVFAKLNEFIYKRVGDKALFDKMNASMLLLRRHLDSWEYNRDLDNLDSTVEILQTTASVIRSYVDSRKPIDIIQRPDLNSLTL